MKIRNWMAQKSEIYSQLCGEEMTRREVVKHHIVLVLLMVGAIAIEGAPMLAVASIIAAGWMVMRYK